MIGDTFKALAKNSRHLPSSKSCLGTALDKSCNLFTAVLTCVAGIAALRLGIIGMKKQFIDR